MKNIFYFIIALLSVSCQDNFDELNDTDQRFVSFEVSTEGFFEDFLESSNGTYIKGHTNDLGPSYRIRVTCYCYDQTGNLAHHSYLLTNRIGKESILLKHLLKDQKYRFEFLADIVKFDKAVDYYESWFQLGYENINDFYLFCFQPDSTQIHNIVRHATVYAVPDNKNISVIFTPITVNGYCILSNLHEVEMVSGYYGYNESFYVNNMSARRRSTQSYRYLPNGKSQIVIPVTTGAINDTLSVKVKRIMYNDIDSTYIYIKNPDNKCFVSEIDCKTLKQKTCVYY